MLPDVQKQQQEVNQLQYIKTDMAAKCKVFNT